MIPLSSKAYGTLLSKKGKQLVPRDLVEIDDKMDAQIHAAFRPLHKRARIASSCPGALIWYSMGTDLL